MIIETSANQFFLVIPATGMDHCWSGIPVKQTRKGVFEAKKNGRQLLVRKIGCRVVEGARYLPAA